MSDTANRVLSFWLDDIGPDAWDIPNEITAKLVTAEFRSLWQTASDGNLGSWICDPSTCLALILVLDQFPRFMFPDQAEAYASDSAALAVAKRAIVMGHDLKVAEPMRQFFYMPLMHSESLMDQERCVRLMSLRLPNCASDQLCHAKAHRDIIRQFGRFPYRNDRLGRASTPAEQQFLDAGGYAQSMDAFAA